MKRLIWLGMVGLLCAPVAHADLLNGDFSSGMDGWTPSIVTYGSEGEGVAEETGGRLHVRAQAVWEYIGGVWQPTSYGNARVVQVVPDEAGLYAPTGTDELQFDVADLTVSDPDWDAELAVFVDYSSGLVEPAPEDDSLPVGTYAHAIALPDLDPAEPIRITIEAVPGTGVVVPDDADETQAYTLTVDGYLDNFRFTPEPATLGLLAAAGAAVVLRRRRRS